MKIKKFEVTGLHGIDKNLVLDFNEDLNILSGRNGAGKTTIIKLMWYLISGNFDKAVAEIKFSSAILVTDKYELKVEINFDNKEKPFSSTLQVYELDALKIKDIENNEIFRKITKSESKTNMAWFVAQYIDSSFFMPTFRMIEGGFTTEKYDIKHDVIKEFYVNLNNENDFNDIEISLKKLSNNLTNQNHKFITSISAKDIDIFLVKKYAEIMKRVNHNQAENLQLLSNKIKLMMKIDKSDKDKEWLENASNRDIEIRNEAKSLNEPLEKIKSAISDFMPAFKIIFDEKIYFAKVSDNNTFEITIDDFHEDDHFIFDEDPYPFEQDSHPDEYDQFNEEEFLFDEEGHFLIDDEDYKSSYLTINNLSAGEKQLLTFVAYNIFHNDTIFFIDEPELSLHVDWQSKLFSLLKEQNPSNQFIISTHSPFIYGLFPDKELVIDYDKGCSEF